MTWNAAATLGRVENFECRTLVQSDLVASQLRPAQRVSPALNLHFPSRRGVSLWRISGWVGFQERVRCVLRVARLGDKVALMEVSCRSRLIRRLSPRRIFKVTRRPINAPFTPARTSFPRNATRFTNFSFFTIPPSLSRSLALVSRIISLAVVHHSAQWPRSVPSIYVWVFAWT